MARKRRTVRYAAKKTRYGSVPTYKKVPANKYQGTTYTNISPNMYSNPSKRGGPFQPRSLTNAGGGPSLSGFRRG